MDKRGLHDFGLLGSCSCADGLVGSIVARVRMFGRAIAIWARAIAVRGAMGRRLGGGGGRRGSGIHGFAGRVGGRGKNGEVSGLPGAGSGSGKGAFRRTGYAAHVDRGEEVANDEGSSGEESPEVRRKRRAPRLSETAEAGRELERAGG